MSGGNEDERRFLDTLSHDLASEGLEDEAACEEALSLGPDANAAIARAREIANRAIAEQRRARIASLGSVRPRSVATAGRYNALPRCDLLRMLEGRTAVVQHRDLTSVPDDDLRTLLEDLDALEKEESDGE